MKQQNSMPLPGSDPNGDPDAPCQLEHEPPESDDFPACLAEALDILADRAKRHGLVEVAHFLEVAVLAARDAAAVQADRPCQPKRKREEAPSALA